MASEFYLIALCRDGSLPRQRQHWDRSILRLGPGPPLEGPALLVVDDDHAVHFPRIAGLRQEAAGHGPGVSVFVGEGAVKPQVEVRKK